MITAAVVATGLAVAVAAAANLGGVKGSFDIGAGDSVISSCDSGGLDAEFVQDSSNNITDVIVSKLDDPDCELAEASVTLEDLNGVDIGSGGPITVPSDEDILENSVTIPVTPNPAAASVITVNLVLVGP